jgi:thiol-disulfide isomerase/thioredoxin
MSKRNVFDYGLLAFALIAFGVVFYFTPFGSAGGNVHSSPRPAPEFTQQDSESWINSEPLSLDDLRGKVVLIDFWTFSCWNY